MRALVLAVVVLALAACEKRDPLFCGMNMNDPRCLAGGDGGVDSQEGYVSVGGMVTGKVGGGLVLLDNGGDDKLITNDGVFQFATGVPQGTAYDVSVGTQPSNPSQNCVVANGSGTADTDVTDVAVTCSTASYMVGGIVVGYVSGPLTLQDNGGDDLPFTMNGTFKFPTPVASGQAYLVGIKSGTGSTCNVSGGFGTVGNSDITTVVVNCTPNTFTIGGMITGLNGTVKLHNGADTISVSANGSFAFPTPVGNNQAYMVTVTQQPAYPPSSQTCNVTQGNGTVMGGNVVTVTVACTTNKFTVGGNVSGLSGTLVLRDNGGDDLTITANGGFTFTTPVFSGLTYAVSVANKPANLTCTVMQGSGTITSANITNVSVMCADRNVKCGSNYCTAGSQTCCDPEGNAQCIGNGQFCPQLDLPCTDAAECGAGKICCAQTHNGNGSVQSVSCQSSCGGSNPVQLCDPNTSECRSGSCQAWNNLPGYNACR
jgi:hypothetical protein